MVAMTPAGREVRGREEVWTQRRRRVGRWWAGGGAFEDMWGDQSPHRVEESNCSPLDTHDASRGHRCPATRARAKVIKTGATPEQGHCGNMYVRAGGIPCSHR